jgi:hypothetical protein
MPTQSGPTRPSAARLAAADGHIAAEARRFVGADRMVQQPGQRVLPAGRAHVVDGWLPVCGEPRVKFAFPGCTLDEAPEVCDACAGRSAVPRVPRQRPVSSA